MNLFKERLAQASIKQVPHHGWTQDAITAAAVEDPKLSISMSGMLSPTELVHWFMDNMNRQLREKKTQGNSATANGSSSNKEQATAESSASNGIFEAIQWRLEQVIPLVENGQWHHGMAIGLSTPLTTKSQLHEFIEIISPEDSSTAFQTALGGIFVATELHLLADSSKDYQETWSFLQRHLDELEKHKDDPSQLLLLSSNNPLSSLSSLDKNIPFMASMAVAKSLADGLASLVLPSSILSKNNSNSGGANFAGTKPSDYETPAR
jgi:rpsU-divergently transcribed protein